MNKKGDEDEEKKEKKTNGVIISLGETRLDKRGREREVPE